MGVGLEVQNAGKAAPEGRPSRICSWCVAYQLVPATAGRACVATSSRVPLRTQPVERVPACGVVPQVEARTRLRVSRQVDRTVSTVGAVVQP